MDKNWMIKSSTLTKVLYPNVRKWKDKQNRKLGNSFQILNKTSLFCRFCLL